MISVLSSACLYGPSLYYGAGVLNTLIKPYLMVKNSPKAVTFSEHYPEVTDRVVSLRKDIFLYAGEIPVAAALGTSFGPSALILYNKELLSVDTNAFNFIIKHEVSHIINNDGFIASLVSSVAALVSAFAVPCFSSTLPWYITPFPYCMPALVASIVYVNRMHYGELRADHFALSQSTSQELMGMKIFTEEEIAVNKELHNKYPRHFSAEGNNIALITHPHTTKRLHEIRKEFDRRELDSDLVDNKAAIATRQFYHEFLMKNYLRQLKVV